jgi:hypothetical protein
MLSYCRSRQLCKDSNIHEEWLMPANKHSTAKSAQAAAADSTGSGGVAAQIHMHTAHARCACLTRFLLVLHM